MTSRIRTNKRKFEKVDVTLHQHRYTPVEINDGIIPEAEMVKHLGLRFVKKMDLQVKFSDCTKTTK